MGVSLRPAKERATTEINAVEAVPNPRHLTAYHDTAERSRETAVNA